MDLPLIATVDDLEAKVGPIPDGQEGWAEAALRYASNLVRAVGNRAWDDPDTIPEQLVDVVVGMAERAQGNPSGVTQDTAGPFTVSYGPRAADRIYLTVGDRLIIRSVGASGAFSFDPSAGNPSGFIGGG